MREIPAKNVCCHKTQERGNAVTTLFVEPSAKALQSIRGKIQPSRASVRNDCDTAICTDCNCNCDDTYGRTAKKVLIARS